MRPLMRPLVIIDIDGTITDFKRIDHEIISNMYKKSKLVLAFDKLLWKINGLDYITNKMWLFKFRIFLYSILSLSSYKLNMVKYQKCYVPKTKEDFDRYFSMLNSILIAKDYELLLISHDSFASKINEKVVSVRDKRRYVLNNVYTNYDIIYVVGNNYMDDIRLGLRLQKINMDLKEKAQTNIVYIGTSKFLISKVLANKSVICIDTFEKFISEFEKEQFN